MLFVVWYDMGVCAHLSVTERKKSIILQDTNNLFSAPKWFSGSKPQLPNGVGIVDLLSLCFNLDSPHCQYFRANEEKARTSPFIRISSDGEMMQFQEYHLTSSCSLNIYRFPFDKQSCNITVLSPMHSGS